MNRHAPFAAILLLIALRPLCTGASSVTNHPGAGLARTYCSACHLFPEPGLLTRKQWAHYVLPAMAPWLGVEPVNFENLQDGKILQEANVYPTAPVVSDADWWKIWNYYIETAPEKPKPPPPHARPKVELTEFRARKANLHNGAPMTCLVKIDATERTIFLGDAFAGMLAFLDPAQNGLRTIRLNSPPISFTTLPAGYCVTLMGRYAPNELAEGKVLLLSPEDQNVRVPLLENLRRPTDTQAGDLDGDGFQDLAVCSFGNRLGRFSWFRNLNNGKYEERILLPRPGSVASIIRDVDKDGDADIFVLMAQAQEGIMLFRNEGRGRFKMETIVEQHPSFGFAGFALEDFNGDGHIDIVSANGDNGDLPLPHKAYHGVRIYLNDGQGKWKETFFYPMEGAFKALPADFDEDGDMDIAAIAFYPNFSASEVTSFVYLKNNGKLQFEPLTLPESGLGRWMVMDAGDIDGDRDIDIVLGSNVMGPTTIPVPTAIREKWRREGAGVLILENRKH